MDVAFTAAKLIHKGVKNIKPEHIEQAAKLAQQVAKAVDSDAAKQMGDVADMASRKSVA